MDKFILTNYINVALRNAEYRMLEDGTFGGKIPLCVGVIAFGDTLFECSDELRSVLEDWILIGLRFGDEFPVIDGVNINVNKERESLETL